jgi:hypothetical protein
MFGILLCMVLGLSKVDQLSCERQNTPRAAQVSFFHAAAEVSAARAQGDIALAAITKGKVHNELIQLALAENTYHVRALRLAASVPHLECDSPFPTSTGVIDKR